MADPYRSRSRDTSPSQSPQSYSSESIYTDYGSIRSHSGREKSPTRLKRAHNKVRTGCITCRKRRVKCDEKKPGCDRCAKADRECEGYRDLVGISKETFATSTESASTLSRPDLSQFSTFLEEEEMTHPYVAFLEQTAPRMAACFISMVESIHEDKLTTLHLADKAQFLWKTLIPDASQNDAATRYAAVALSILHESLEKAQTVGWQDSGFTRSYNRAIAIVKEGQPTDQLHHMLLPCILFAHCELLMGSLNEAMTHIISGSRIITGMQSSGSPLPAIVKNIIAPILNGFIAKSQISGQFETQFHFPAATHAMLAQFESIPTAFASFAEAGRSLCELLYQTLLLQELGQPSDRHQATAIRKQANSWSTAFDGLRFAKSNIKSGELRKFQLILLAQHRMLQVLLKSMPPEADVHFQHATSDFKIMLAQIRTFVSEVNQGGGIERSMRNVIPVHAGVIMPLFFIAIHCQTAEVRRGALDLLERLNLTEGQWNSCFARTIAAKLIEVNDSMVQSKGKHGLKLDSPGRLRPVGLEKTCVGHVKLQCLDVTAEEKTEDISEVFIDDDCFQDDLNASWPFNAILRCHGFQGPIRSQTHQCRYQHSANRLGIPGSVGVSPFTSPSPYQMQANDSYFSDPLDESVLDPTAFFNYGIH